jgi:hypothetical protein
MALMIADVDYFTLISSTIVANSKCGGVKPTVCLLDRMRAFGGEQSGYQVGQRGGNFRLAMEDYAARGPGLDSVRHRLAAQSAKRKIRNFTKARRSKKLGINPSRSDNQRG